MILLKITNSSELIAAKMGNIVERLIPDDIDDSTVESLVLKELVEKLSNEGIKGEISSVKGIEVSDETLVFSEGLKVRNSVAF